MENVYNTATKSNASLVCRAKEVMLTSIKAPSLHTCKLGEMVEVDLLATISMTGSRYDLGWYIAQDGGDALTGNCTVNTLGEDVNYAVKNGLITWAEGSSQPVDTCGDVLTEANGTPDSPILIEDAYLGRNLMIPCQDINDDGHMDFSVCFTWRTPDTNEACNPEGPYPGSASKCDCATWDIDVTVEEENGSTCV
jgi:hypothetical protein